MSLGQLLRTCDSLMRVWIWHNGEDAETLAVVREYSNHPNVFAVCISGENKGLQEPTNWFWTASDGTFLSKVDDDCLLPIGWAQTLREAHEGIPDLGIVGCWRFYDEDLIPELARRKVQELRNGHRIMRHWHVQGSGYVMKREVIEDIGLLRQSESFTQYCTRVSARGWKVGWYFPFVHEEHMDDARSIFFSYKSEQDFRGRLPLSAIRHGVSSLEEWKARSKWLARHLQEDTSNGKSWTGWRGLVRRLVRRLSGFLGYREPWRRP